MNILHDARFGLRQLRGHPGFALVAVLILAVSIGSTAAIFSVADTLLLRTLPVRSPDRLVTLKWVGGNSSYYDIDSDEFAKYRDGVSAFSSIAASELVDRSRVTIAGKDVSDDSSPAHVDLVSGRYFTTLGVNARAGVAFSERDDRPAAQPVAVISDEYRARRFAGGGNPLGRSLTLNGTAYTIIGVMPRGFSGDWVGRPADIWIPLAMHDHVVREAPGLASVRIIARLRDEVQAREAEAAIEPVFQEVIRQRIQTGRYPPAIQRMWAKRVVVETLRSGYSPQREAFTEPVAILMGVVSALLLIACANVATLVLARATSRQREIVVRRALGASQGRIIRQLLTESLLLSAVGGSFGILLALWGAGIFARLSGAAPAPFLGSEGAPANVTLTISPHVDVRVIAFSAALCGLVTLLFGLAPAISATDESRGSSLSVRESGPQGNGLRRMLVIAQVALSLLLVIVAGLFEQTLRNLRDQDLGFDRGHVLLVWTNPFEIALSDAPLWNLWQTARERISSLPGVESAAVSNMGLLNGFPAPTSSEFFAVPGQPARAGQMLVNQKITAGYFRTVGITVVRGRDFTPFDTDRTPPAVILNETMARFYFGSEDPIGRKLDFVRPHTFGSYTVVGVVSDAKNSLRETRAGVIYYPSTQTFSRGLQSMVIAVRTLGNPAALAARVRQELHAVAPELPIMSIDTIDEQLDAVLSRERLLSALAGLIGMLALLLACFGLYGLLSFTVACRTKEFGVRMALGARPVDVMSPVLRESTLLVLWGILAGVAGALAATRLIANQLFGVRASDPIIMISGALLMMVVAAISTIAPTWRATRVDPMVALRCD